MGAILEPIAIILTSLFFIVLSMVIITLSTKIKSSILNDKNVGNSIIEADNFNAVGNGHVYAVDMGDSMVIVVVMDKKNVFTGFLNAPSASSEPYSHHIR